jgi:hypothetical protein
MGVFSQFGLAFELLAGPITLGGSVALSIFLFRGTPWVVFPQG